MIGEGNGTPLQYSCLENPMGGGALVDCSPWGCEESDTTERLIFTFHFHALEKETATHSSVLAWRIPGTGEPGGLPSMAAQSQTRLKRLSSSILIDMKWCLIVVLIYISLIISDVECFSMSFLAIWKNVYSIPCPFLSWWYCLTISFSVIPFSFCLQSFPASGSFPVVSQLFASCSQSIGASASASVLSVNIQGWFPLGLTGSLTQWKWIWANPGR